MADRSWGLGVVAVGADRSWGLGVVAVGADRSWGFRGRGGSEALGFRGQRSWPARGGVPDFRGQGSWLALME